MSAGYGGTCVGAARPAIVGAATGRRSSAGVAHAAAASPAAIVAAIVRALIVFSVVACAAGHAAAIAVQASAGPPDPAARVAAPPDAPIPAGAEVPLRLEEAVALGLRDNRTVRSAYLERIAQRFTLVVAHSRFVPRIVLDGSVEANRTGDATPATFEAAPTITWLAPTGATLGFAWSRRRSVRDPATGDDLVSLILAQPLLRGGGLAVNRAPIRIADIQERINKLALRSTVIATVSSIVFAYRALVQAQAQVGIADLALQRNRQLLDTNRALIAAGRLPAADIVQAEAQLATQEVLAIQARQQRRSAQLALSQLLAADPRSNLVAADPPVAQRVEVATEVAVANAIATRPDALAQLAAIEQGRQQLLVARNNRLWQLDAEASAVRTDTTGRIAGQLPSLTNATLGVRLSIPLYEPAIRQQVIQAEIGVRTAELRYEDARQSVETQVRDAVQTVDASWLQLDTARRARTLAGRALDIERAKLAVGRTSNFEVLAFQLALRSAETQELGATIGYLNALTALDQQIGSTLDTWRITLND